MAANIQTKVVQTTIPTSTGNQDITSAGFGTPQAVLFFATRTLSGENPRDYMAWSYGAATGAANEWAAGIASEHNQATSDTFRVYRDDACIALLSPTAGSVAEQANFVEWITDGVRINWSNAASSSFQWQVTVVLINGLTNAQAGSVVANASQDGFTAVSTGFEPDVVLMASTGQNAIGTGGAQAIWAMGVAHNNRAGTITQRADGFSDVDGQPATTVFGGFATDATCGQFHNGAWSWKADLESFDGDGFDMYSRGAGGGSDYVGYLALELDGDSAKVVTVTSPTSMGNEAVTGIGFQPEVIFQYPGLAAAADTIYSDNTAGTFQVSVINPTEEWSGGGQSEDAADPTNTQSYQDIANGVVVHDDDGVNLITAVFVSMDAGGWTLNYTTADGTPRLWPALTIGAGAVGGVNVVPLLRHRRQMAMR